MNQKTDFAKMGFEISIEGKGVKKLGPCEVVKGEEKRRGGSGGG